MDRGLSLHGVTLTDASESDSQERDAATAVFTPPASSAAHWIRARSARRPVARMPAAPSTAVTGV